MSTSHEATQELFKESEVVKMLGTTRPTLEKWRRNGYIKFIKIGKVRRYTRQHIDDFIERFSAE